MSKSVVPMLQMSNGLNIPQFGLGTWKSKPGEVKQAVKYAIMEAGYRHIDCAHLYGNEDEIGEALSEIFASGFCKREDVFITSKCWNTYHDRSRVMECCKKSLTNLGLNYLDLYLIHWPHAYLPGDDPFPSDGKGWVLYSNVDYLETWKGMEDCVNANLVKSIGLSNFNSAQIERILSNCSIKPVMNQVECHPYLNQEQLFQFCKERSILLTAYSPLGSSDRPMAKPGDPKLLDDPVVNKIANKYNKSPAQILLRFIFQRGMVVIPKSVNQKRIKENIDIFNFELQDEDMDSIRSLNRNLRFVGLEKDKDHPYYPFNIPF